jgi:hypothetical protein
MRALQRTTPKQSPQQIVQPTNKQNPPEETMKRATRQLTAELDTKARLQKDQSLAVGEFIAPSPAR